MKRAIRLTAGTAFLILGVLGLFLPILQGILFILTGLLILSPESRRIRRFLEVLKARYPHAFERAERLKHRFTRSGNPPV